MRHLSRGVLRRLTTMLDYAQTHIFDAVTTCSLYQGRLLLILILHSVMHDITSTLPVGVNLPLGFNAKWPPHVNRRRAPGVLRLGFNGYALTHSATVPSVLLMSTRRYIYQFSHITTYSGTSVYSHLASKVISPLRSFMLRPNFFSLVQIIGR